MMNNFWVSDGKPRARPPTINDNNDNSLNFLQEGDEAEDDDVPEAPTEGVNMLMRGASANQVTWSEGATEQPTYAEAAKRNNEVQEEPAPKIKQCIHCGGDHDLTAYDLLIDAELLDIMSQLELADGQQQGGDGNMLF